MTTQITSVETSPATLAKASAGAAAAAALVFTLFVLPAETGIDPTGVGGAIGLTVMAAEPKAEEAAASPVAPVAGQTAQSQATIAKATAMRNDEMTVTLEPHSGTEVKAHMQAGDSFVFRWEAKGGPVKLDMHGEPPNAGANEFTTYWKEKELTEGQGTFTAPFEGAHGWYWRNKGETPVTITVRTTGFYKDLYQPDAS